MTFTIVLDGAEADIIVRVLEQCLRSMFADAMQTSEGRDQMFEVMRPYVHIKDALDSAREERATASLTPGLPTSLPAGFGPPPAPPIPQMRPPMGGLTATGTLANAICMKCGGTNNNHRGICQG